MKRIAEFLGLKPVLLKIILWFQVNLIYKFRSVGYGCRLGKDIFVYPYRVSLGDRVYIGRYAYLDGDITVGDHCMISSSVAFVGGDHKYDQEGVLMIDSGREHWAKTTLQNDVWVGYGAIIMNGITIGEGAIVAAGAVVCKDVPSFSIVAGVPARVIRMRFSQNN